MDLVVMGGGWYSGGREFDSQHCILDGHFFTFVCLKRLINKKEPIFIFDTNIVKKSFIVSVPRQLLPNAIQLDHL